MKQKFIYFVLCLLLSASMGSHTLSSVGRDQEKTSDNPWQLLQQQLVDAPVKTAWWSREAWTNRSITAALWYLCLNTGWYAFSYAPDKLHQPHGDAVDPWPDDNYLALLKKKEAAANKYYLFGGLAFVATAWTAYRSQFFLVHTAEKEAFADFLTDFEINKQYLPPDPELIALFEKAYDVAKNTPQIFKQESPRFIQQIKQCIQNHASGTT